MAIRQLNQSWRDEQARRHYPFSDFGPPTTLDSRELPLGVILDANLHPLDSPGEFYLAQIEIAQDGAVRFFIGDGLSTFAASGEFSPDNPDASAIQLLDLADEPAGVLVVDPASVQRLSQDWPPATYSFSDSTAQFVISTWNYTFGSPTANIAEGVSISLAEDLYLVGAEGVRLTCDLSRDEPLIRVNAIGDPLARLRDCSEDPVPRFIREVVFQKDDQTIRCEPNENGEIYILVASKTDVQSALRLYASVSELKIGFASSNQG